MINGRTGSRPDIEGLRDAIERRDPQELLGFYAEDAEVRVVNGDAGEGPPFELRGKAEIESYLRAVCDRDTTCQFGDWVSNGDQLTFSEVCEYPDGARVVVRTTLDLRGGEIVAHVDAVVREAREGGVSGSRTEKTND